MALNFSTQNKLDQISDAVNQFKKSITPITDTPLPQSCIPHMQRRHVKLWLWYNSELLEKGVILLEDMR